MLYCIRTLPFHVKKARQPLTETDSRSHLPSQPIWFFRHLSQSLLNVTGLLPVSCTLYTWSLTQLQRLASSKLQIDPAEEPAIEHRQQYNIRMTKRGMIALQGDYPSNTTRDDLLAG